jgi:dipeptidyl aminopeptidase/acylaminoacyl peptidase
LVEEVSNLNTGGCDDVIGSRKPQGIFMLRGGIDRRQFALGVAATWAGLGCPAPPALRVAGIAGAATPSPMVPRRLFFGSADRSGLSISPNGTKLAWIAPLDGIPNVWVAPIEAIGEAKPVTRATDRAVSSYAWAWTSRHIVFFRDHNGDENLRATGVDIETGAIVPLTPPRGVKATLSKVSRLRPTEILFAHNARDKKYLDTYLIDIETGASSLVFENREFEAVHFDTAFNLRFAQRMRRDGSVEVVQRTTEGGWAPFIEIPHEDNFTTRIVSTPPGGETIFLIDSSGRDKGALYEHDLKSGRRELLAEDHEADITGVLLHPDTERPIAAQAKAAKVRWHVLDPAFRDDFAHLERYAGRGEITFTGRSGGATQFSVLVNRDDASGEFVLYDRRRKESRSLFRTRPKLDALELRPMLPVVIPARDGLKLPAYLTLPSNDFRNGPLMLLVHGGPWSRDNWGYNSQHQWLANRGYAVLSVNFRGSTGFGKAFISAADREWGGRMHDDLIDAVEWAVTAGYADRTHIGVMGASYGGYAALTAATKTPEVFACVVDIFGISNLTSFMASIPPYWEHYLADFKRRLADPATEQGQAWLRERSPLHYVDRIKRPLLIVQGMNDVRVVPAESEQMVRAMQERRIPVIYVTFADEGHGFIRQENRFALNAVIEQFLARHLGGRAEPIGDALVGSSLKVEVGGDLVSLSD